MSIPKPLLAALSLLALAACGGREAATSSGLRVTRDTVGDTVVVRTVSGSVWGAPATLVPEVSIGKLEGDAHYLFGSVGGVVVGTDGTIYVLDYQADEVRAFDPAGTWLRTFGRKGGGPGELGQPNGLAILPDGRILVRDDGNQRIQVYGADGSSPAEWPYHSGFFVGGGLWSDQAGNAYLEVRTDHGQSMSDWRLGLVRFGPDGTVRDTLPVPRSGFGAAYVEAHSADGGATVRFGLPFAPAESWAFAPGGYFVHGVSTDYGIDVVRPDAAPLRVEKAYEPVVVQPGEKEAAKERTVRGIRASIPDWKWSGAAIPDHKPPFRSIMVGRNDRLWVMVPQPGQEEPNPDYDPKREGSPATRWAEPVGLDVFRPDGTYLGRVNAPTGFSLYPRPFFRGDTVWAVTRDSLGVQRVVRYHVQHGGAPGS